MKTTLLAYLKVTLLLLLLGFCLQRPCWGQASPGMDNDYSSRSFQSKRQKIDSLLQLYAQYGQFNGTVLVAEAGELHYKQGFGFANLEWNAKNQSNTKFRLASMTKQFTAMLALQLVAKGALELSASISTCLPDYPKKAGDIITIHHLLSHTSGIPNYTSFPNYRDLMRQHKRPEELVPLFADSTLQFPPGERFSYSNSGYALLGVIIEKITGKRFEEVLSTQILEPLGMKDSGYDSQHTVLANRATGYDKTGSKYRNSSFIDMSVAYTAGGMYSTVEDLFLWDKALYTDRLLPQQYRDLLFKKHIRAWGDHYGYGWIIGTKPVGNTQERVAVIEHDGVINGFNSLITRIPETASSIIILSNTSGNNLHRIAESILGILYDKPYDLPKQSLAWALSKLIEKEGLANSQGAFHTLKDDPDYYLDEGEMNLAGYEFIETNQLAEAAFIFKQNLAAFPHSFNTYDSYGEVLLKLGKEQEAIEYYKKSVAYNPQNENGRTVLKELGITEADLSKLTMELLVSDKEWGHEIFHFPLNFAPEIPYKGREDARFPPGWRDTASNDFWSYVFAWHIEQASDLSIDEVTANLQLYFDGIMKVVNKDKGKLLPKTVVKLHQEASKGSTVHLSGTLDTYDSFITREPMTLNVRIAQYFCRKEKKATMVFRFSPKPFGHEIWSKLEELQLREEVCRD